MPKLKTGRLRRRNDKWYAISEGKEAKFASLSTRLDELWKTLYASGLSQNEGCKDKSNQYIEVLNEFKKLFNSDLVKLNGLEVIIPEDK